MTQQEQSHQQQPESLPPTEEGPTSTSPADQHHHHHQHGVHAPGDVMNRQVSALDPHLVWFRKGDKEDPFQWSNARKAFICFVMCLQITWVTTVSAIYSPANAIIAEEFGLSHLAARIAQAMFLVGFSIGPVFLSPLGEDYGRKPVFTVCLALTYIFQIPCALAPNYGTLVVCRLISGIFASPIFNSVANIPDLWAADDYWNSWALNAWAFSAESFIVLAPVSGTYIVERHDWPWIFWWSAIVGAILMIPFLLFVPETRQGVLLARRARKLRKSTGKEELYAEHEVVGRRTLRQICKETLVRPVFMLMTEPIVFYFALYDGLNYCIFYLVIETLPLIYGAHGIEDPKLEFMFFSPLIGCMIGICLFYFQKKAEARFARKNGGVGAPEAKLFWGWPAAPLFSISMFLFGWLSYPFIHWMASLFWLGAFAISGHILFLMVSDYTVESYGHLASSAVTAQSFLRETMSAGLVIVGETYYENLGAPVATSILGAISVPLGLLPFLFYWYGPKIRERSSYSLLIKEAAARDRKMQEEEALAEKDGRNAPA